MSNEKENTKPIDRVKKFYDWVKSNKITSTIIVIAIIFISSSKLVSSFQTFEKSLKKGENESAKELSLLKNFIENDLDEIISYYDNYDLSDTKVKPDFDILIKIENLKERLERANKETEGKRFLESHCKKKVIELKDLIFPTTYELYKKYKSQIGKWNECNYNKKVKANCDIGFLLCEFPTNSCSNNDIELLEITKNNVPKIIKKCN